ARWFHLHDAIVDGLPLASTAGSVRDTLACSRGVPVRIDYGRLDDRRLPLQGGCQISVGFTGTDISSPPELCSPAAPRARPPNPDDSNQLANSSAAASE